MANKFTDAVFKAKLPGTDKGVLYALAMRADNVTGVCWPTHQTIAEDSGFSYGTVRDSLRRLYKLDVVSISGTRPGRNGPINEYTLNYSVLCQLGHETTQLDINPVGIDPTTPLGANADPVGSQRQNSSLNSSMELVSSKLASLSTENSTERGKPDTLDADEQKRFDWAVTTWWVKFTPTMSGFRKGCLESDNFEKQYQAAMKKAAKRNACYGGNGSDIASEVPSSLLSHAHAGPNFLSMRASQQRAAQAGEDLIIAEPGDDPAVIARMNAELRAELLDEL